MSTLAFPVLKTGLSVQHPFRRRTQFSTRVLQFMDGGEQRIAQWRTPWRDWQVSLSKLDDSEVSQHAEFFEANLGGSRDIRFTDPIDGQEYTCGLAEPTCDVQTDAMGAGNLEVVLVQRK